MATREIAIPINARNITFDTFDLVRGLQQSYDLPGQFVTAPGGTYGLTTPVPAGFSVNSSTGAIIANLRNRFSYNDANAVDGLVLRAGNYQPHDHEFGYITIPTTIRDWFPSDLPVAAQGFISLSRSYDGSANDVLFSIEVLHHQTGVVLVSETDISTGDDGYVDEDAIETAVGNIQNGIIVVSRLRAQITNQWVPSVQEDEDKGAIGYVTGGTIILFRSRTNGRIVLRGQWSAAHLEPDWTTILESGEMYYQLLGTLYPSTTGWAFLTSVMNRNHGSSGGLGVGDQNVWPGLQYLGSNQYTVTNKLTAPSITVTGLDDDWAVFYSGSFYLGTSVISTFRRLQAYSLETGINVGTNTPLVGNHGFGGIGIRNEAYDFAEYVIFKFTTIPESDAVSDAMVRTDFADNSAFYLRGNNLNY